MRKISRHPRRLVGFCAALIAAAPLYASADEANFYQSNTQYGVALPNTSLPTGSDEVRAADGTSCRSAVGGDGAYMDTGVIGSPGQDSSDFSGAVYTRLVVPLGGRQKRLNCESLYELEIQRLRMELDLARMGLSSQGSTGANWQDEGWSYEGTKHKTAAEPPAQTLPTKKAVEKAAKEPTPVPAASDPIQTSSVAVSDSLY